MKTNLKRGKWKQPSKKRSISFGTRIHTNEKRWARIYFQNSFESTALYNIKKNACFVLFFKLNNKIHLRSIGRIISSKLLDFYTHKTW